MGASSLEKPNINACESGTSSRDELDDGSVRQHVQVIRKGTNASNVTGLGCLHVFTLVKVLRHGVQYANMVDSSLVS